MSTKRKAAQLPCYRVCAMSTDENGTYTHEWFFTEEEARTRYVHHLMNDSTALLTVFDHRTNVQKTLASVPTNYTCDISKLDDDYKDEMRRFKSPPPF